MPQKTRELLEQVQKDFQDCLSTLFENIGLQEAPKENTSIRIDSKTAFDLHRGQKFLGICRMADLKNIKQTLSLLETFRAEILRLKRFLGYKGNLERSFLIPVVKPVTARSVTISVSESQKIIPIKAGQIKELAGRHPGESFFKKLLETGHWKHLGTQYLTVNFRYAPLGEPQAHVKGGVVLVNESGKPLQLNFRFSGINAGITRADKIQDRPILKIDMGDWDYEFWPKSGKSEDMEVFIQLGQS